MKTERKRQYFSAIQVKTRATHPQVSRSAQFYAQIYDMKQIFFVEQIQFCIATFNVRVDF